MDNETTKDECSIHSKTLTFKTFFDDGNRPTCSISTSESCHFLGFSHLGFLPRCMFKGVNVRLDRENGNGYIQPHKECPFHGSG